MAVVGSEAVDANRDSTLRLNEINPQLLGRADELPRWSPSHHRMNVARATPRRSGNDAWAS
jgi:hypothetical protein